ncbi:4-hydroxythreonine-4-phosphate dehydrogenase PdxA [Pelomonas sp. SE-A7]|uniref:4-hydroxythreonine-4-phosphate dehydrogenase PdxA n=1 Tax=Pelomonas sp. SE-A7 TaxID=3054953 RepID=UPI00259CF937|nr:4-hydroxythreonine-4-phosphate dehydrogenase PdxA [Pelomonas sp. SE-A7]MDM4766335.1 4-hydroxythreonine-4-phosphate dehydrogenase PdxA [Pelomonas sp. SE-A7]
MSHPKLLLTMGDACGIGPEIIARLWDSQEAPQDVCVVGDLSVMRRAVRQLGLSLPVARLDAPDEAAPPNCLPVWQPPGLPADLLSAVQGQVDARAGAAAAACIEAAVRAVQQGQGLAIVTAPIHKEALHAAGLPYPGHTEMLQALATTAGQAPPPVRMMLANDELRTVLVTIHMSLRQAIEAIDVPRVLETIRIADQALRSAGIASPRIAVAGLNPHAGEGGLFGDEEIVHIAPAIAEARAAGLQASGPFAPDTVFMRARRGEFDAVVAMVHDHGLIPVKYLGVEQGVNVTLGLPFVRTSPDHGTAFDIAGRGIADASSLRAALQMARRLSRAG